MEQQRKDPLAGLAFFISAIFHPLLMPTYFFLALLEFVPFILAPWNDEGKYMLWGIIWIFTFIFPLILCAILFYTSSKNISEFLNMYEGKDRVKPFLMVGCTYLLFSYLIQQQLRLNHLVTMVISNMGLTIIIAGLLSYFWKVSIHAMAFGGMLGFFYLVNEWYAEGALFYIIIATIVVAGTVMTCRLYLHQHTEKQVYLGFLLGVMISIAGMFYLR